MKKFTFVSFVILFWMLSIWMSFWLGFSKSQSVAIKMRSKEDMVQLHVNKSILASLIDGDCVGAKRKLQSLVEINKILVNSSPFADFGLLDAFKMVIYPREYILLIDDVDSSSEKRKK